MGKNCSLIITNILLLIVFLKSIKNTFELTGNMFLLELTILIILIVMATDSIWQYTKGNKTSTGALSIFFAIVLVNELGLNIFAKMPLHLTIIITAALGFIINLMTKEENNCCPKKQPNQEPQYTTQTTPIEEEKIIEYKTPQTKKKRKKITKKKKIN